MRNYQIANLFPTKVLRLFRNPSINLFKQPDRSQLATLLILWVHIEYGFLVIYWSLLGVLRIRWTRLFEGNLFREELCKLGMGVEETVEVELGFCKLQVGHWVWEVEVFVQCFCSSIVDSNLFDAKLWSNLSSCHHATLEGAALYNNFVELVAILLEILLQKFSSRSRLSQTKRRQCWITLGLIRSLLKPLTMPDQRGKMICLVVLLIQIHVPKQFFKIWYLGRNCLPDQFLFLLYYCKICGGHLYLRNGFHFFKAL